MLRPYSLCLCICILLSACTMPTKKAAEVTDGPPPKLLAPNVRKIWIPPSIKNGGSEWEAGHYLYRIERETKWSR